MFTNDFINKYVGNAYRLPNLNLSSLDKKIKM